MRQGYWVVRTYEAGIIGEKTKFWVAGDRPRGRSSRKEKAELRKQEKNEYAAVKRLARLMHANFGKGDLVLGLDYSDAGLEKLQAYAEKINPAFRSLTEEEQQDLIYEAAQHEAVLCLRRVARAAKSLGLELKYILITSDTNGDTRELVRIHHHLIINKACVELFKSKWAKLGGIDYSPISRQADYTPIAEYLLRQVRRRKDENKFASSRNLIRPQPKDRVAQTDAELRIPKGGKLLFRQEYRSWGTASYQPQYIRYIIPHDKQRKIKEENLE